MGKEITLEQFVSDNKISMDCQWVPENPNMSDFNGDHWLCFLRRENEDSVMPVYFSMGHGHHGRVPTIYEVLDCLAMDSNGVEETSFEDWCSEYGYDEDSRTAEDTYDTIKDQAMRLRVLLDDEAYERLIWGTERL